MRLSFLGRGSKGVFSIKGIVLLFALVFSVGAALGVSAWKAAPAEAIENGVDAAELGGQVQLYVSSGRMPDKPGEKRSMLGFPKLPVEEYKCTGTLISTEWILTAKHCVTGERTGGVQYTPMTLENSGTLIGDKRLGKGEFYKFKEFKTNDQYDTALIKLAKEAPEEHVVGYGTGILPVDTSVNMQGWGLNSKNAKSKVLQKATEQASAQVSGRLALKNIGQGHPREGDSGAGAYINGVIYGVYSGEAFGVNFSVPTENIAPWIEEVTGVGPSGKLNADQGDEQERKEQERKDREEQERKDKAEQELKDKAEQERKEQGRKGKGTGKGSSASAAGESLADLAIGKDTADKDAKEYVSLLADKYPGYNVMVIQVDTYGGPEKIEGVVENYKTGFGDNTWDVWVFESGTFINDGDLGYDNWVYSDYGNVTRSGDRGNIATFEPIE